MGNQRSKLLSEYDVTIDMSHLQKLFHEHDADQDGFLSGDEVHVFLKELIKQSSKDVDVAKFLKDFDLVNDGKLGFNELLGGDVQSFDSGNRKSYTFPYIKSPSPELRNFAEQFDNYIIDCDGVLWRAGQLIPGAKETLNRLRKTGKKLVFCTNNSTRSRAEYKLKFDKYGIAADINEIVTSTYAAALLLKIHFPQVRKAYVIGSSGLRDELKLVGIECVAAPQITTMTEDAFNKVEVDKSIKAVVGGFDPNLSYGNICMASLYAEQNKCPLVVTSRDEFDQLDDRRFPAIPIILKEVVERITGVNAHVAGKPSKFLIDELLKMQGWDSSKTVMIGDRTDSDMLFAGRGGVSKLLVMTGCTREKDLETIPPKSAECPDFVIANIGLINNSYNISRL